MIVEKNGKIFHDEHDIEIKIGNDNTKQTKIVQVKIRSDGNPQDVMELAKKLYEEAMGS